MPHRSWLAVTAGILSVTFACSSSTPTGPTPTSPPTATPPTAPPASGDAPPPSAGHSLVYATHVGMVVLVNAGLGGANRPAASTPTRVWGWTGSDWRLLDSSGPPVRNLAGVTYDTRRNVLVMHGGGYDLGRSYGETWEWSAGWRQVSGTNPGVRDHMQMAFDRSRGRSVLFGGSGDNPNVAFGDTWEYDGTTWTRAATDGPPARVHHAMHFDQATGRVVVAGGNVPGSGTLGDVWAWDGSRWMTAGSIAPRSHGRMTFHRSLNALVLAGGTQSGIDLLINRGGSWTPQTSSPDPGARLLTDIAYDEMRNVMVMFGGTNATGTTLFDDTWEFDGTRWRRVR